jgi:hypothetical protein
VQTSVEDHQTGATFIPPGQLWKNGLIESLHDKFRNECLNCEWFQSSPEAQVALKNGVGITTRNGRTARSAIKPRRT